MYQFEVNRKKAIAKEATHSNGLRMALPIPAWLMLLTAVMLFFSSLGGVNATPAASTKSFMEACLERNNITHEELDQFPDDPSPEDVEQKFKCYANCLLDGMGILDENGKIMADSMHEWGILSDESYENMIECKAANDMEDDPCEYSFGIVICARVNIEHHSDEIEPIEEERRK
ncbi:PREDICTED: general odorant-binding protein 57c-like isoform X2 [Rhagoletis zephyria]|uniref:general odorant-binding protein 57c-like isoform X2 n=1 Tax=Rhagoletis zephyria TaxID=28612 RepID=UPI0008112408|nr:PREDICTED: general odorant-binding protein 57c-like isoform X2 [Rhagoletis zephyria]